jgi:hypothetical protein
VALCLFIVSFNVFALFQPRVLQFFLGLAWDFLLKNPSDRIWYAAAESHTLRRKWSFWLKSSARHSKRISPLIIMDSFSEKSCCSLDPSSLTHLSSESVPGVILVVCESLWVSLQCGRVHQSSWLKSSARQSKRISPRIIVHSFSKESCCPLDPS